jgi:hypothetical protein
MSHPQKLWLIFPDGGSGEVAVTPLADGRYRLEATPLLYIEDVYFGDEIAVTRDDDGQLLFAGVVRRSGMRTYSWLLSRSLADSSEMARFREAVAAAGGKWEHAFGGCCLAHVPADSPLDVERSFVYLTEIAKPDAPGPADEA